MRRNVVSGTFFGYSVELLSAWCLVSPATAAKWKRGEAMPSPQALRLFELHRERRVLGSDWPGWLVNGNRLVDPDGNETTQSQLRAYFLVYQLCRELARDDPRAQAEFQSIMKIAG